MVKYLFILFELPKSTKGKHFPSKTIICQNKKYPKINNTNYSSQNVDIMIRLCKQKKTATLQQSHGYTLLWFRCERPARQRNILDRVLHCFFCCFCQNTQYAFQAQYFLHVSNQQIPYSPKISPTKIHSMKPKKINWHHFCSTIRCIQQ